MYFCSGDPSVQLFKDYQYLMRIWTHPWILKMQNEAEQKVCLSHFRDFDIHVPEPRHTGNRVCPFCNIHVVS